MMLRMDFIPVHLTDAGDCFEITSGYTDTEIEKSDLQSVQLLENRLSDVCMAGAIRSHKNPDEKIYNIYKQQK